MKRTTILAGVAALALVTGSGLATAAQEKVDICHRRVHGSYVLVEVGAPAYDAHIAHGDAQPGDQVLNMPGATFDEFCVPQMTETVFAVAYSDVDGIAGFDAAGDVLIAKVVDANGSGDLDVDDEVVMGRYPKNFEATEFGDFGVGTHVVTSFGRSGIGLLVRADTAEFFFEEQLGFEQFYELFTGTNFGSDWGDTSEPSVGFDFINTNTAGGSSPSQPDDTLALNRFVSHVDMSDDAFVDVDIFLP